LRTTRFLAASERTMRLPLGGSLCHWAVDNVVAAATSANAANTLTFATASGSHRRELRSGLLRGTMVIHHRSRMAA
jgi:hypothetical protein